MDNLENGKFYREKTFEAIDNRLVLIENEIKNIKENHLEHIQDRLNKIENKMAWYGGGIVAGLGILEIALKFIK